MKIAFIDSGLGVLPALQTICRRSLSHECFFLMSDLFPLGNRSDRELAALAERTEARLRSLGVERTFVCCNTLSSFFGGERTYRILDYNRRLLDENTEVLATVATARRLGSPQSGQAELARLIEERQIEEVAAAIRRLRFSHPRVLLACTHYPLIRRLFCDFHPGVAFVDGMKSMLEELDNIEESESLSCWADSKALPLLHEFFPGVVLKPLTSS